MGPLERSSGPGIPNISSIRTKYEVGIRSTEPGLGLESRAQHHFSAKLHLRHPIRNPTRIATRLSTGTTIAKARASPLEAGQKRRNTAASLNLYQTMFRIPARWELSKRGQVSFEPC